MQMSLIAGKIGTAEESLDRLNIAFSQGFMLLTAGRVAQVFIILPKLFPISHGEKAHLRAILFQNRDLQSRSLMLQ